MTETRRSRRTILSAPGDNWNLLSKQASAPSDVAMIDLEHAVHPDKKPEALRNCVRAIKTFDYGEKELLVRINNPHTAQFATDLTALSMTPPEAYLVPKVSCADDAKRALEAVESIEASVPGVRRPAIWYLIESPGAVLQAEQIAKLPRTQALVLGHGDLEQSVGFINTGWMTTPSLQFARNMLVFAAASAGIDALDGAIVGYLDPEQVENFARHSALLGLAGALIVSPRQIEPVHRGFRPTDAEIEQAQRIITAFSAAWKNGNGVAVADGHFLDDVIAERAVGLLRRAGLAIDVAFGPGVGKGGSSAP